MSLPPDFVFSQASLQDYADCPRRFQLRYLMELAWPAVAAEPADAFEARIVQGEAFHRMAHQHGLGLPPGEPGGEGAEHLAGWWAAYLAHPPADLPPTRHPELALSAPVGEHRLIAQFDLIAIAPGHRAVIVDWKTSEKRPPPGRLAARFQTRVYRYLLVRAGAHLNGGAALRPEQVTMVYWFANFPEEPERLPYTATQYAADEAYLAGLVAEIGRLGEGDYPLTTDVKRCVFCPYRSLCNRGIAAGELDSEEAADLAQETQIEERLAGFDFEQVAEISF